MEKKGLVLYGFSAQTEKRNQPFPAGFATRSPRACLIDDQAGDHTKDTGVITADTGFSLISLAFLREIAEQH